MSYAHCIFYGMVYKTVMPCSLVVYYEYPTCHFYYYIPQLIRELWLVNLAGRILLYGPLKFKVGFVTDLFFYFSPSES